MKERTFYTFNLDVKRILLLVILLIAVLVYVFLFGRKIGQRQVTSDKETEISKEIGNSDGSSKANINKSNGDIDPNQPKSDMVDLSKENLTDDIANENEPPLEEKKDIQDPTIITSDSKKAPIAKPRKTPPVRKKVTRPRTRYTIQLGAFSTIERATDFRASITNHNDLQTMPYIQPRGDLFLVRLGNSTNRSALEKIIKKLDMEYAKSARIVLYTK